MGLHQLKLVAWTGRLKPNRQVSAPAMVFRQGPVFANLVLADEINRAAPICLPCTGVTRIS